MGTDVAFELSKAVLGDSGFEFLRAPVGCSSFCLQGRPIPVGAVSMAEPEKAIRHLTDEVVLRVTQIPAVRGVLREKEDRIASLEGRLGALEAEVENLRRYKLLWTAETCRAAGMTPQETEMAISEAMEGGQ